MTKIKLYHYNDGRDYPYIARNPDHPYQFTAAITPEQAIAKFKFDYPNASQNIDFKYDEIQENL